MARFTDLGIERYKPKLKKYNVTEGGGLYLQVSPKGKKTWLHRYEVGGKRRWLRLGEYPAMSLKEARNKNDEFSEITIRGEDPKEIENINIDPTIRELYEEWIGKAVDKQGKPWSFSHKRNTEYLFKKNALPKVGGRKIKEIRKAEIRSLLEKVEARAPNQALQLYRRLTRLFNYATEQDIIKVSPMATLNPIGYQGKRDRFLNDKELEIFLSKLPESAMVPNTAAALELVLRTGQRPSEVVGAHQDEFEGSWWTIPANRTKNGRENRVYLTPTTLALFGDANEHGFFFPSLKNPNRPIGHTVLSKALRRSLTGKEKRNDKKVSIPIDPFTPHDLRRTCATGLAKLGHTNEIIGAVLNHKEATVTGIYNRYQYDREKQIALEAWDRKLHSIMAHMKLPDNVVPFKSL